MRRSTRSSLKMMFYSIVGTTVWASGVPTPCRFVWITTSYSSVLLLILYRFSCSGGLLQAGASVQTYTLDHYPDLLCKHNDS